MSIKWITVIEIIVENRRFPNLKIFKSMTSTASKGTVNRTRYRSVSILDSLKILKTTGRNVSERKISISLYSFVSRRS